MSDRTQPQEQSRELVKLQAIVDAAWKVALLMSGAVTVVLKTPVIWLRTANIVVIAVGMAVALWYLFKDGQPG